MPTAPISPNQADTATPFVAGTVPRTLICRVPDWQQ